MFGDTGGLHAAGLFTTEGALVAAREDVGRHNAVDKLVGWALEANVAPAQHVMFLSGRAGYELVQKASSFGVPLLAAVSRPTGLAIRLAESAGMTLVGLLRDGTAAVYAGADGLRVDPTRAARHGA